MGIDNDSFPLNYDIAPDPIASSQKKNIKEHTTHYAHGIRELPGLLKKWFTDARYELKHQRSIDNTAQKLNEAQHIKVILKKKHTPTPKKGVSKISSDEKAREYQKAYRQEHPYAELTDEQEDRLYREEQKAKALNNAAAKSPEALRAEQQKLAALRKELGIFSDSL